MQFNSVVSSIIKKVQRPFLLWAANSVANDARKNSAWSKKIPGAIEVGVVEEPADGMMSIEIAVNLVEAPEALAFEYGSGIWGKKGEKYPILPKTPNGKLAFDWPEAANIGTREGVREVVTPVTMTQSGFEGGRAILPGVMHPGVQAKPYMAPAIEKNNKNILIKYADISAKAVADGIVIGIGQ